MSCPIVVQRRVLPGTIAKRDQEKRIKRGNTAADKEL
jgi:hypothetical protein